MEDKKYKCLYCHYWSNNLDEVKEHEEKLHGCFRDINPRNVRAKKRKAKLVDSIWCARELPIHNNPGFRIDVLYELYSDGKFRMYTDDLKYGDHLEIVFDNEKQMYTIKDINKVREDYYNKLSNDVVAKVDSLKDFVNEMS